MHSIRPQVLEWTDNMSQDMTGARIVRTRASLDTELFQFLLTLQYQPLVATSFGETGRSPDCFVLHSTTISCYQYLHVPCPMTPMPFVGLDTR